MAKQSVIEISNFLKEQTGLWRNSLIEIRVTKTDIKRGNRNTARTCPIALAIRRAFPKHKNEVTWVRKDGHVDGRLIESLSPIVTENFVNAFDRGESVNPFNFHLTIEPARKDEN